MHERLSQTLQSKGIEAPKIRAAYLMKIGGFLIQSERLNSTSDTHAWDNVRDWEACVSSIYHDIINALKRHPNICDVKALRGDYIQINKPTVRGLILQRSPVRLHLNLPGVAQTFSAEVRRAPGEFWPWTPIESFDVITNGSLFAAYTQIEDWPHHSTMAHEFRELFQEHINATTQCKVSGLGPTPIHPDFYIVILDPSTSPRMSTPIFEAHKNIFHLLYSDRDIEEVVAYMMTSAHGPLSLFYATKAERADLVDFTYQIYDSFTHLSNLLRQHRTTRWYHLTKHVYPGMQVSTQIEHIYEVIFAAQERQFFYDRSRKLVRDSLTATPLLAQTTEYFMNQLENVLVMPGSFAPRT